MNKSVALKFAVSALAIGSTMVACGAPGTGIASASSKAPKSEQDAASLYARAEAAVRKGEYAEGLGFAERAVELSPRDVGYRMILADLYLKNGRFQSAETTFADVQRLDPGNARAAFSIALARIALGRPAGAVAELDRLAETASPADIGLAYALAGEPQRAIELLEPAARVPTPPRVRQNLVYPRPRRRVGQSPGHRGPGLSPADSPAPQQWAGSPSRRRARPRSPLARVTPREVGQPVRSPLRPAQPAGTPWRPRAAAEPARRRWRHRARARPGRIAPEPVAAAQAEPVQIANGGASAMGQRARRRRGRRSPARRRDPGRLYAEAVQALVTPSVVSAPPRAVERIAPRFEAPRPRRAGRPVRPGPLRRPARRLFLLSSVERDWARCSSARLRRSDPAQHHGQRPRHGAPSTASRFGRLRQPRVRRPHLPVDPGKGGACFVRTVAGDPPVRWPAATGRAQGL